MARIVFLVGFMGCGKSKFGRRLAIQAGMDFVDTDRLIEHRAGMSIPEIFAVKGEAWFRELEGEVIAELSRLQRDTVVALGGGAVCRQGVMEALNAAGRTIYIKMSPERLVGRIDAKGRLARPKIAGMDDEQLLEYVRKTLPEREKDYNKANFVIGGDAVPDEAIVGALLEHVKSGVGRGEEICRVGGKIW